MNKSMSNRIAVIMAFILVIAVNVMANALPIGGRTTGEISAKYPSLFTPAGYTFSIWSLIYLGLAIYVVYQALPAQRESVSLAKIGKLFLLNCAANIAWILVWHHDLLLPSLFLMLVILATLAGIYRSLGISNTTASCSRRWCVHLPFSLYTAWITVATIANFSIVQTGMGWDNVVIEAVQWTCVKLGIAGAVGATMVLRRGDIAFILVIAWAAIGIAEKQASMPAVAGAAGTVAVLAFLLALFEAIKKLHACLTPSSNR